MEEHFRNYFSLNFPHGSIICFSSFFSLYLSFCFGWLAGPLVFSRKLETLDLTFAAKWKVLSH